MPPGYEAYVLWEAVRSTGVSPNFGVLYDTPGKAVLNVNEINTDAAATIFDGDCAVNADAQRIEQVITNLVVNAIKYTPHGGKIHLATSQRRGEVSFTIENHSPPLSSEALSKVWFTFYRVEEARTGDGTGLGLSIAKSIIDLHGGQCSVWNTKTGVKFSFALTQ